MIAQFLLIAAVVLAHEPSIESLRPEARTLHKCKHKEFKMSRNIKPQILRSPVIKISESYAGSKSIFGWDSWNESSNWRPISIHLEPLYMDNANKTVVTYFMNTILGDVIPHIQKILKVRGPRYIPAFAQTGCFSDFLIDRKFKTGMTKADLILFVAMDYMEDMTLAYATSCLLNSNDYRPVVGMVVGNARYMHVSHDEIESLKATVTHEILHVLGFDEQLLDYYPAGASNTYKVEQIHTQVGTSSVIKIILPNVVSYAKKFYNCDSISGVYFENEGPEGSVGSHWEKSTFGNEMMTAESSGDGVLSMFTLHLLNDSGWYEVDFEWAELFNFGRGAGCDFVNGNCTSQFPEYCPRKNSLGCNRNRTSKTFCYVSAFSDQCIISLPLSELRCSANSYPAQIKFLQEEFGNDSRCFDFNFQNVFDIAGCYKVNCMTNQTYQVRIMGENFTCGPDSQSYKKNLMKFDCPNYKEVCNKPLCPNHCSGNGVCLENGKCLCDYFYTGTQCEIQHDCHNNDTSICDRIRPPAFNETRREDNDSNSDDSEKPKKEPKDDSGKGKPHPKPYPGDDGDGDEGHVPWFSDDHHRKNNGSNFLYTVQLLGLTVCAIWGVNYAREQFI
jgi:leishmanolysin